MVVGVAMLGENSLKGGGLRGEQDTAAVFFWVHADYFSAAKHAG